MKNVIMQDIHDRLDPTTALNYRSRNDLKRELGQVVSEDIKSLCSFIRSEATTLELAGNDKPPKKVNYMHNDSNTNKNDAEKKCHLGCDTKHRLVDCEEYMKRSVDDRTEVLKTLGRCFICLGISHTFTACSKKDDKNWPC